MNPQTIISWFQDANNVQNVFAVLGAVYTIALVVVKITPSKRDDELLSKAYGLVHKLMGILGVKK